MTQETRSLKIYNAFFNSAKRLYKKENVTSEVLLGFLYGSSDFNQTAEESLLAERAIIDAKTDNYQPNLISIQELDESLFCPIESQAVEYASRNELYKELENILSELPERQKQVLVGRFYEDKTLKQIGEGLGMSKERVRSLECKALTKLRKKAWNLLALKQHTKDRALLFA